MLPSVWNSMLTFPFVCRVPDLRWERNELVCTAFPRLRTFCADEHGGLDLHVVDMRWGVTDDATSDHATEELCLSEIKDCQRRSLGTCFVVSGKLGNKQV